MNKTVLLGGAASLPDDSMRTVSSSKCMYTGCNTLAVSMSSLPLKTVTKRRRVLHVDQEKGPDQLEVPVTISATERKTFREEAIVDSRCTETFIDQEFVKKHKIPTVPLKKPVPIRNVDGSLVGGKMMTENAVIRLSVVRSAIEVV